MKEENKFALCVILLFSFSVFIGILFHIYTDGCFGRADECRNRCGDDIYTITTTCCQESPCLRYSPILAAAGIIVISVIILRRQK